MNTFGESLKLMRTLFLSTDPAAQPLVVSGSGTLGWDFVAANLVERGEEVLVLHSGMRQRSSWRGIMRWVVDSVKGTSRTHSPTLSTPTARYQHS